MSDPVASHYVVNQMANPFEFVLCKFEEWKVTLPYCVILFSLIPG